MIDGNVVANVELTCGVTVDIPEETFNSLRFRNEKELGDIIAGAIRVGSDILTPHDWEITDVRIKGLSHHE